MSPRSLSPVQYICLCVLGGLAAVLKAEKRCTENGVWVFWGTVFAATCGLYVSDFWGGISLFATLVVVWSLFFQGQLALKSSRELARQISAINESTKFLINIAKESHQAISRTHLEQKVSSCRYVALAKERCFISSRGLAHLSISPRILPVPIAAG